MPPDQADIGELMSGIAEDSKRIASGYVDLAKGEIRQELDAAKISVVMGSAGAMVSAIGLLFLALGAGRALADATTLSLAGGYAVVGLMVTFLGGMFLVLARWARARKDLDW